MGYCSWKINWMGKYRGTRRLFPYICCSINIYKKKTGSGINDREEEV